MLKKCLKTQCPGNPVCVCAQRAWGRNGTPVMSMVASEGCVVDMEETQPCSGLEQVPPFP